MALGEREGGFGGVDLEGRGKVELKGRKEGGFGGEGGKLNWKGGGRVDLEGREES